MHFSSLIYYYKNSLNNLKYTYNMERTNCVICENILDSNLCFTILNTVNIVSNLQITSLSNSNEIHNLNFVGCSNCGCIQLRNLFLQSDIYSEPLQIFDGYSIQKHHELFCDFVIKNVNYQEVLFEIGGSYGNLAKKIIKKYNENSCNINYKIMEFSSDQYPPINNIEYISGNCEEYEYTGINTIIMSHVFEHLYKPRDFIKKISKTNIQNIFISIPDMDGLSKIGDINNLNILHTYYINSKYIIYLFQLYGFILKDKYDYINNSIFYYFIRQLKNSPLCDLNKASQGGADSNIHWYKSNDCSEIEYKQLSLINEIPDFYLNKISKIKTINIFEPFFICPSGFYGQFIYFYLNESSKINVIGFLDGDPYKINKRLSGTVLNIYNKNKITDYDSITILISSSKHSNELKQELLLYNNNITFINIYTLEHLKWDKF